MGRLKLLVELGEMYQLYLGTMGCDIHGEMILKMGVRLA